MASTIPTDLRSQASTQSCPATAGCPIGSGRGKYLSDMERTKTISKSITQLKIATWNIRTLQDSNRTDTLSIPRRSAIIARELQQYKIDVAAFQETHMKGTGTLEEKKAGYTYYWCGSEDESNQHGVAICVRTNLIRKGIISSPTYINERLMHISIVEDKSKTILLCCYAPTNVSSEIEKDEFYNTLGDYIKSIPRNHNIILAGDFNARVGKDYSQWKNVIGKHGIGITNDNGLRLLQLCALEKLSIMNTFYQQKDKYKATWKHPRSKNWHMIDFIITRHQKSSSFMRCRAMRGPQCDTDHFLVRATVKLKPPTVRAGAKSKIAVRNSQALNNEEIKNKFKVQLENEISVNSRNVESTWTSIKNAILRSAEKTLPHKHRTQRDWFDESNEKIEELLKKKRTAHENYLAAPSSKNRKEYQKTRRIVQKEVRVIQENWWNEKAKELEDLNSKNDMHNLYRCIKELVGPIKKPPNILENEMGEKVYDIDSRLQMWNQYFDSLFNQPTNVENPSITLNADMNTPSDNPPTRFEIEQAISMMKNNKSPGLDNITSEMLKAGEITMVSLLETLFEKIWYEEAIPVEWKQAVIVPIHKKGSKAKCENYRGISLLSVPGKVLSRILYNRLFPFINSVLSDTQCGFRHGRSTIDMIFTTRQVIEKAIEQNTQLSIGFIDISKAFDCVDRRTLFLVLEKVGCPPNTLKIVKCLYEETTSTVRIDGTMAPPFNVQTGVKQGCVLAPLLFLLYIQVAMNNIYQRNVRGVEYNFRTDTNLFNRRNLKSVSKTETKSILDLMFADDCAIVTKSPALLQEALTTITEEFKKFGLKINESKTEVMFVNHPPSPIYINQKELQITTSFKYLGSIISKDGKLDAEINNRINAASNTFRALYPRVWKPHNISLKTKLKIYETTVLSTLLYSSECWTLLEDHAKRLNYFHIKCLKTILKITWRDFIPNEEVLKRAQILSADNLIRTRRLRWAGHVSRMSAGRVPLEIAFSELTTGKRPQHKPKRRWMDVLKEDLKKLGISLSSWRDLATNRNEWRENTVHKIQNLQERTIVRKEIDRQKRHEEEDKCTWQCPYCSFSREGRHGRRYVLSHITQKHIEETPAVPERGNTACPICVITYKSKAGLQSHIRNKHPVLYQTPAREPIKIVAHINRQSQISQNSQQTTHHQNQLSAQQPAQQPIQQAPQPVQVQQPIQTDQNQCRACHRVCKSKAGRISHERNVTCRAVIEEMETSDTMTT